MALDNSEQQEFQPVRVCREICGMTSIKEKIENNVIVWMLGTLLTGFLAGIGTYKGALEIMSLETVGKERLKQLESTGVPNPNAGQSTGIYSVALPDYLNSSELELIFSKIKAAYNEHNANALYQLMGPMGKAQLSEETASLQMEPVFQSLGNIQNGFYIQHQYLGQQGLYKFFTLNYSVKYEKAQKGFITITVIDDGKSYQINSMMFNRL